MTATIQIRNVPAHVHRQLKARAALAGMSLTDFVLAELQRSLERPTRAEVLRRIAKRSSVDTGESIADALRAERDRG